MGEFALLTVAVEPKILLPGIQMMEEQRIQIRENSIAFSISGVVSVCA
jgi:hypothetical protein